MSNDQLSKLLIEVQRTLETFNHSSANRHEVTKSNGSIFFVANDADLPQRTESIEATDTLYMNLAKRIYDSRRARESVIGTKFFADPVWDILLDLFYHQCTGTKVSITSCCIAACVPATTALRWIGILIEEGLIARLPSTLDRRSTYVELTERGISVVRESLQAIKSISYASD